MATGFLAIAFFTTEVLATALVFGAPAAAFLVAAALLVVLVLLLVIAAFGISNLF